MLKVGRNIKSDIVRIILKLNWFVILSIITLGHVSRDMQNPVFLKQRFALSALDSVKGWCKGIE